MNILEKEIEDLIWEGLTTDPQILEERGLCLSHYYTYVRQLDLGNYGRADIVGFITYPCSKGQRRTIKVFVIEIKKDNISIDTLLQAARYATAIKHKLKTEGKSYNVEIEFVLIGKDIDTDCDFIYTPDYIKNISLYKYKLDLRLGLTFEMVLGYKLVKSGFKESCTKITDILKTNLRYVNQTLQQETEQFTSQHTGEDEF